MKTFSFSSPIRSCLLSLALLLPHSVAICKAENSTDSDRAIPAIQGPSKVALQGIAELALPEGYTFLQQTEAQAVLRQLGAGISGKEIGLISPASRDWFVVLLFLDIGYIDPLPKNLEFPAQLLADLQTAERVANEERASRQRATVSLQDWDIPPSFDIASAQMEWAVKAETQGKTLINHYIARLGRSGVLKLCLVDQHRLASTTSKLRELARQLTFKEGERVSDHVPGDRLAQGGLSYLVTGKIQTAAVGTGVEKPLVSPKTGKVLMRVFWLGFFALIAVTVGYVSGLVAARRAHYGSRRPRPVPSRTAPKSARTPALRRTRAHSSESSPKDDVRANVFETETSSKTKGPQPHRQFDPWMYYQRLTRDLYNHG